MSNEPLNDGRRNSVGMPDRSGSKLFRMKTITRNIKITTRNDENESSWSESD